MNIWSFFKGYIVIKVSGFSVERFINLAINKNIYLSDVCYKDNYVTMKVSVEGFKMLKPIAKKTKCKVTIISKVGLPFFVFRYRKRKFLFFGVLFFVATIYMLSTHIWLIDISGLDKIYKDDIESFIASNNLYIGSSKRKIDVVEMQEALLNEFPDIAWVNISIKGTRANVSIKETIEKTQIQNNDTPSNLVATKDAIIDKIVVSTGSAVVKPHDVVKEGDILISGELKVKEDEFGVLNSYVHSSGIVLAKTYYEFDFFIPYEYEEQQFTGKQIEDSRYNIFNKNINVLKSNVKYENYNRVSTYNEFDLGYDYPLPFIAIKDIYKEIEVVKKTRTKEEAKELATVKVDSRILRELAFDVNIVDKKINLKENSKGIEVSVHIDAIEDITKSEDIEVQNTPYSLQP